MKALKIKKGRNPVIRIRMKPKKIGIKHKLILATPKKWHY